METSAMATSAENIFRISVHRSFDEVEPKWRLIEREGDCFAFQSFDWLNNWHRFIGRHLPLQTCIVLVEGADGQPYMILPLAIRQYGFISCLVWLGGDISDYHGPLLARNCVRIIKGVDFHRLWGEIQKGLPPHDAIHFVKQPSFIGGQKNPFLSLSNVLHQCAAHSATLTGPLDEFIKRKKGAKWASDQRRKQRRLEDLGVLKFFIALNEEEIEKVLPEMIAQKAQRYRETGVENLFAEEGYVKFFNHMARHYGDSFVQLCALTLNDKILAAHWGLVYKKRFYHLFPTYLRGELSRYSQGVVLMLNMFNWAIENHFQVYDFTLGDEAYKDGWCDQGMLLYDHLKAKTLRGAIYVIPRKMKRLLKRNLERSPTALNWAREIRRRFANYRRKK